MEKSLDALWSLLVDSLLCFSPEVEVQWIQIRGMSWPADSCTTTDDALLELFHQEILGHSGAVRRCTILHPPVVSPSSLSSKGWPCDILKQLQITLSID